MRAEFNEIKSKNLVLKILAKFRSLKLRELYNIMYEIEKSGYKNLKHGITNETFMSNKSRTAYISRYTDFVLFKDNIGLTIVPADAHLDFTVFTNLDSDDSVFSKDELSLIDSELTRFNNLEFVNNSNTDYPMKNVGLYELWVEAGLGKNEIQSLFK